MAEQIIRAKWAFIEGAFHADRCVRVKDSKIVEVGTYQFLAEKYPSAEVIGGDDYLMLPGLVNSHDHGRALGTTSLGIPDQILEVWIDNLAHLPGISPELAASFEGLQLIQSGVTSVAHSHNPASLEAMFDEVPHTLRGYQRAGVRVAMHPPMLDQNRLIYGEREAFLAALPAELRVAGQNAIAAPKFSLDAYFAALTALYENSHDADTHQVHIQVSPVGGQWASDTFIQRSVEWARARATRVQMHMLETRYQREYAHRKWNKSFIQHLDEIGALGDWLILAHMVWIEDSDIPLLAERGVRVAHNPSSNLRLRSGIAPVAALHQAGVKVGIGLDGYGLDDDQDFLREMRLAFTLGNRPAASAPELSPAAVLEMGTCYGAEITFGEQTLLGVLAPGYLADVVLIDWSAVKGEWCPPNYPSETHLPEFFLRRVARGHVRHVMVHGKWMLRDGKHTRLDEAEINRAVRDELASQPLPVPSALAPYIREFYAAWEGDDV